ncbi:MAG: efflux RND transporter permease subunit, partial [Bacteroidota bacterium]
VQGSLDGVQHTIQYTTVENGLGQRIPVSQLISIRQLADYQKLVGGEGGLYAPISFDISARDKADVQAKVEAYLQQNPDLRGDWAGTLTIQGRQLWDTLGLLALALVVLYAILAAQFESLIFPLIVLIEVPIDLAAAAWALWLGGSSLNLMSMIGMIVLTGIIINDSILKIDTIQRLIREGTPLEQALHLAGKKRFNAILMTSMTTILAVLPFLFTSGLGADLQRPLALALIGGMGVGTLVSLFFIPVAYRMIYRWTKQNDQILVEKES